MSTAIPNTPPAASSDWILVVDDEKPVRTLFEEFLVGSGIEVVTAPGGEEALTLVQSRRTEPVVAFLDVMMPGIDGLTLARKLRARFKRGRIIIMSGHLTGHSWWPEDLRSVEFIAKPFGRSVVLECVEAARRLRGN
jgi:two-component system, cell cycle sensor histidine kinase and response regulator CckA